jgi:hypothetical protein
MIIRKSVLTCLAVLLCAGAVLAEEPIEPKEKIVLWNGKDFTGWKLYLCDPKADVNAVWSVIDGVILCKGKPNGYMRTVKDYANYTFHVEWRWVAGKGNSGVLLHMREPDKVWPKSIECQLMSGNAGDFWLIGGTEIKEHIDKKKRRVPKKCVGAEKPLGEWNRYDIVCKGNKILPYVNGVLVNEATEATVCSGKICLQSEGKPIMFRNIYIAPPK